MATIDQVNDITPVIRYVGTNGQDTYAYPFPIFEAKDIIVVIDGVELTLTTDYNLTGVTDDFGGNVVLVNPTAGGEDVLFYRDTVVDRLTFYIEGGDFLASTVNDDFDRIILMIQEVISGVSGSETSIRAEITDPADLSTFILPLDRKDKLISFNANGDLVTVEMPVAEGVPYYPVKNTGSVYELGALDSGVFISFNSAGLATLQIPDGLPIGTSVLVNNVGGGSVVFVAIGSETIRGELTLGDENSQMAIFKVRDTIWQSSERV